MITKKMPISEMLDIAHEDQELAQIDDDIKCLLKAQRQVKKRIDKLRQRRQEILDYRSSTDATV